jgi:6,7-dimethyl-8-ribityllumazine synthase
MVKGITAVAVMASEEAFTQAGSLLRALGFEPGKGWSDAEGKGAAFLAPIGNLELVTGRAPGAISPNIQAPALLVEVTQLDAVFATVKAWAERHSAKLTEVAATHWNSRLFTVTVAEGLELGFWESENPLHGRPVAIEGDLSAAGKRFAIVVILYANLISKSTAKSLCY